MNRNKSLLVLYYLWEKLTVAEMLQKYFFMFNVFLSKNIYIYIQ